MPSIYHQGDEPIQGYQLLDVLDFAALGQTWKSSDLDNRDVGLRMIPLNGGRRVPDLAPLRAVSHPSLLAVQGYWLRDKTGRLFNEQRLSEQKSAEGQKSSARTGLRNPSECVLAVEPSSKTLAQRLVEWKRQGKFGLPGDELLRYITQAAAGLDYLYRDEVCRFDEIGMLGHGQIEPLNMALFGDDLRLIDWGVRKVLRDLIDDSTTRPSPYRAPEHPTPQGISAAGDQYSLALCFLHLRLGEFPSRDEHGEWKLDDLPSDEVAAVDRALAEKPGDRYPTFTAFAEALKTAGVDRNKLGASPAPVAAPVEAADEPSGPFPPTKSSGGSKNIKAVHDIGALMKGMGGVASAAPASNPAKRANVEPEDSAGDAAAMLFPPSRSSGSPPPSAPPAAAPKAAPTPPPGGRSGGAATLERTPPADDRRPRTGKRRDEETEAISGNLPTLNDIQSLPPESPSPKAPAAKATASPPDRWASLPDIKPLAPPANDEATPREIVPNVDPSIWAEDPPPPSSIPTPPPSPMPPAKPAAPAKPAPSASATMAIPPAAKPAAIPPAAKPAKASGTVADVGAALRGENPPPPKPTPPAPQPQQIIVTTAPPPKAKPNTQTITIPIRVESPAADSPSVESHLPTEPPKPSPAPSPSTSPSQSAKPADPPRYDPPPVMRSAGTVPDVGRMMKAAAASAPPSSSSPSPPDDLPGSPWGPDPTPAASEPEPGVNASITVADFKSVLQNVLARAPQNFPSKNAGLTVPEVTPELRAKLAAGNATLGTPTPARAAAPTVADVGALLSGRGERTPIDDSMVPIGKRTQEPPKSDAAKANTSAVTVADVGQILRDAEAAAAASAAVAASPVAKPAPEIPAPRQSAPVSVPAPSAAAAAVSPPSSLSPNPSTPSAAPIPQPASGSFWKVVSLIQAIILFLILRGEYLRNPRWQELLQSFWYEAQKFFCV